MSNSHNLPVGAGAAGVHQTNKSRGAKYIGKYPYDYIVRKTLIDNNVKKE